MKRFLKNARSNRLINLILRTTVIGLRKIGVKVNTTHFPVSGIVTIKLPENNTVKLFSKGDDYIPSVTYWNGYDAYEKSIIPFYYLSKKANTIIDIGANIGYYSLIAKAANPKSEVFAFEPVPRIAKRLSYQNKINQFDIKINEAVVGNTNSTVKFYVPKGNLMSLASSIKKGWVTEVDEISVPSITLDQFKIDEEIKKIDLIKMDCEFHELEVLKGMENMLKMESPIILSEILFPGHHGVKEDDTLNQYKEIQDLLLNYSYYFYQIKTDSIERVKELIPYKEDRNYIFSKVKSKNVVFPFNQISSEII